MASRVIALVCGLAMVSPFCAPAPALKPAPHRSAYLFGAELPNDSLICVDRPFSPDPDCLTLGQLRRLVRQTGAN